MKTAKLGSEDRFIFDSKDSNDQGESLYIEQHSDDIFSIKELNRNAFKSKSRNRNNTSNECMSAGDSMLCASALDSHM